MFRILFGILLLGHGLIHVIGFLGEYSLGMPPFLREYMFVELNDTSAKIAGVMWLVTALLWIIVSIFFFRRKKYLWKIALVTAIISQLLIIIYWPFAEFGTIMNILVIAMVIVSIAKEKFNRMADREWISMAKAVKSATQKEISSLPPVVIKWLSVSKSSGRIPSRITLTQKGAMRSKPKAEWMSFSAIQYYTIDPPAFLWNSQVNAGKLFAIAGRDKFENGRGNMLIKPLYVYTLANTSGHEIDQGAMIRYMAEIVWFPEAAMMDYFDWKTIDPVSAELTMTYKGTTAKGVFTFDDDGLVKSFTAQRFGDFDGQLRQETWHVNIKENREINGRVIGTKCDVTWKLKEGDFTWLNLEVKDVRYDW